MILLDTDHFSILSDQMNSRSADLTARVQASRGVPIATTIVSVEEQLGGWLALIHRLQDVHKQLTAYAKLGNFITFLSRWTIIPLDQRAADEFQRLRRQKIRVGTQDLKIACIALVNGALLLSANLRDFRRVPDLRVES